MAIAVAADLVLMQAEQQFEVEIPRRATWRQVLNAIVELQRERDPDEALS
jgi:hypothetical protein